MKTTVKQPRYRPAPTLESDIRMFSAILTPHDLIQMRLQGEPWYRRGKGNRAAKRCMAIVERMNRTGEYGPQIGQLLHFSK